jgi:hypothetical protein
MTGIVVDGSALSSFLSRSGEIRADEPPGGGGGTVDFCNAAAGCRVARPASSAANNVIRLGAVVRCIAVTGTRENFT